MLRPALTGPVLWIVPPVSFPVFSRSTPTWGHRGSGMCSRSSFPSVGCEAVGPRTTGASLLMAPTDPGLCEDGSNSLPRDGRKKTFRTCFLSALPLASLALEDGGSALPLAEITRYDRSTRGRNVLWTCAKPPRLLHSLDDRFEFRLPLLDGHLSEILLGLGLAG